MLAFRLWLTSVTMLSARNDSLLHCSRCERGGPKGVGGGGGVKLGNWVLISFCLLGKEWQWRDCEGAGVGLGGWRVRSRFGISDLSASIVCCFVSAPNKTPSAVLCPRQQAGAHYKPVWTWPRN